MISFNDAPFLIGSLQSALDQPLFPGKILIWVLLMLSIISWVKILSKSLQLMKIKKSDKRFSERLRRSRTTLELFEEGWRDEDSSQFLIYLAGARETAFQLLGSRAPSEGMGAQVREAGLLPVTKARVLERAFESGYRQASMKVASGVGGLRFIGAAALLLGLIGSVWALMSGFDALEAGASLGPVIGSALGFVLISLIVATPAFLARIAFSIQIEHLEFGISKFREDIARLFERKFIDFGVGSPAPPSELTPEATVKEPTFTEEEDVYDAPAEKAARNPDSTPGKKQYHSIRDRLLRPPSDDEDTDELQVNPIARQAARLKAY